MAGAVVAQVRPVDCTTKMCANGRQAAERVALADEKDPFLFQKRDRTVWVILRLAGLKNQARFEQHIRHKEPNSSCREAQAAKIAAIQPSVSWKKPRRETASMFAVGFISRMHQFNALHGDRAGGAPCRTQTAPDTTRLIFDNGALF